MEGAVERELVLAARRGDEVAFARLIEAEAPRVYRAVLAVVGSPDDAQEVVQDASIRAWRHIKGLRDDDRWAAWYRRIAVRQAIDRAGGRRKRHLREVSLEPTTGDTAGPENSLDPTGGWIERVAVMDALGRLSSDDRAILGLRFGADLEVADVAAVLGIPLGTAKSRLHRALGRLAAAIGEDDGH
jgi:RNA polymerase sigma-70 factor (ECF subfamily)